MYIIVASCKPIGTGISNDGSDHEEKPSSIHPQTSVALSLIGLLGPVGILRDGGEGGAGHAGRLHHVDVLTGQTRHQLLAGGAVGKEELVGHAGQHAARHRPDPVHLNVKM